MNFIISLFFLEIFQIVFEMPFNSVRRYQLVVARCLGDGSACNSQTNIEFAGSNNAKFCVMIKGAPEVILNKCSLARINDDIVKISEDLISECEVSLMI